MLVGKHSGGPSWVLAWMGAGIALWSAACGGTSAGPTPRDGADARPSDAGAGDAGDAGDAAVNPNACEPGQTQPCVCTKGGIGKRGCISGLFGGACTDCVELDTDSGTLCEAGRYEGLIYTDRYYPAAAGLCGLVTVFGSDSDAGANPVDPGPMAFTLSMSNEGVEFFEVVGVGNCLELAPGQVDRSGDGGIGEGGAALPEAGTGDADGGSMGATPVGLGLTGHMDCATGEFTGELRGVYKSISVCDQSAPQNFSVKGTIRATYNPETKAFEDGSWVIHEPAQVLDPLCIPLMLCEMPGGEGTWEAKLNPNASAKPSSEPCYDVDAYEDFLLP